MKIKTLHFIIIGLLFLSCFLTNSTLAQDDLTNSSEENSHSEFGKKEKSSFDTTYVQSGKNCIYGGIGFLLLYAPAYIYYERKLQDGFLGSRFSSFINVGSGIAAHWEGASAYVSAKFGLLLGEKKSHLETAFGLSYFYFGDLNGYAPPVAFSIGYRAQNPGEKFVFRTGIGWPESIYVSWGYRF